MYAYNIILLSDTSDHGIYLNGYELILFKKSHMLK